MLEDGNATVLHLKKVQTGIAWNHRNTWIAIFMPETPKRWLKAYLTNQDQSNLLDMTENL